MASSLLLVACSKGEGDLLAAAKASLAKNDLKSATIELKNLLQKNPASGEARFLLGKALLESGDPAGAEAELERALERKYSDEAVAPVMAKALVALRQYRKLTDRYARFEVADFQAAVDLKVALAMAHAAQGQKDEARAAVARALAIKADAPEARLAQARLDAGDGNVDGALATLDALLAKSGSNAQAWQLKGDLLLHAKADATAASAAYRKAIEARNDLPEPHAALITLAFAQKDLDGAARQLDELKKILPKHPLTRFFEAQVAFAKAEYPKARELLQPLLRAAPENVRVLHLAGVTEMRLNSSAQASTLLAKAVQLAPNFAGARRALAQVHLRERQPAKAQAVLQPIVDGSAADSESLSLMAQASAMLGDGKTADEYFARAAKLKPDDRRIRAVQALGQIAKGDADAGFVELENLAASDKGGAVDLAIISAHVRRNEIDQAFKAIDALDKKQPDSPVAPNLRGRLQLQKKDFVAARKSFEQALVRDPKFVAAAAALATMDLADKKPEDAKGRFQAVLKADPKSARAMLAMAELGLRTGGTHEQATKWIGDAVAAEPSNLAARMALIDHHTRAGDFKSALAAAQTALGAQPNEVALIDKQARLQLASGNSQLALTSFTKVTQLRPDSVGGFIALAEAQLVVNDIEGAARSARRAIELEPKSLSALRLSITVAMQQKRPRDALALARGIQTQQPNDAVGFLAEGEIELDQKNFDNAIAAFRKATAKAQPGQAPARLHRALRLAKHEVEAAKFAETWIAGHPKDTLFIFYLGDVALGEGDQALAERRYAEVLKIQPEHALALNNVAWLMVQQKRPGAVALAERAVKAAPNQPPLMDTLALALAAESQLPKALELQKKTVQMAPEAPMFRLTLAKLQLQAGEKAKARVELEKLAKLGPKFAAGQDEVARLLRSTAGS